MGSDETRRRLIVNADDFGQSRAINAAVIRAHREGILTTASLMVNGDACDEAVTLARENPRLGVGLHLALVCGKSTLPQSDIPDLVSRNGSFSDDPVRVGMRYYFIKSLLPQLRREIAAQFERFTATGLALDHVNGHLNLHLHPVIFKLLLEYADRSPIPAMRLTRDPLWLDLRLARGNWGYRLSHALVFGCLSRAALPALRRRRIRHTKHVFGLLQTSQVDTRYVAKLLSQLPPGDSELYSHPSLDKFIDEFNALISSEARQSVRDQRIELIRYQDL